MSALTAILNLIKNVDGDNARTIITTDESANMDTIDALFHATTGHDHTGTGTKGTKIPTAALAANAVTQTGSLTGTGDVTTNSATFVDMTNMAVTLTTTGGDLMAWFAGSFRHSVAGAWIQLAFSLDAAPEVGPVYATAPGTTDFSVPLICRFVGVAAGSHTVKVRWCTSQATTVGQADHRHLMVMEVKR